MTDHQQDDRTRRESDARPRSHVGDHADERDAGTNEVDIGSGMGGFNTTEKGGISSRLDDTGSGGHYTGLDERGED